jgi:hypothetical protein
MADDELREYGIITEINDCAYPIYSIAVEFPERKMVEQFSLNIEAIDLDVPQLNALLNKYVTIYFTADLEANLLDLQLKGKSILGEEVVKVAKQKSVTGLLSGAESDTQSYLPDLFTIKDATGNVTQFSYFITSEMTKGNGKEVTAFYVLQGKSNITKIVPSAN